jgi:4-amino-4-deoxy-L-arabinose transferase-like glycosyltransferase
MQMGFIPTMADSKNPLPARWNLIRLASVDEQGQPHQTQPTSHFWLILAIILLFCAALKLPTLTLPHDEPDEQIYWQLASRLLTVGHYNLQGTEILKQLSPPIYDRPIFCHPPLFAISLIPFVHWQARNLAVLVSWLGHFLCIIAVAVMGRRMAREECQLIFWLPVIGMALDPFLAFLSGKLWIDSLLAGLCAASIAFFFCARYSERRGLYLVAGSVLFGLAGLAKLPALALAPVIMLLILTPVVKTPSPWRDLCLGCLPALILILPWFIIFHHAYGVFLPSWTTPDEWTMQRYPMVRTAVERNPLYYIGNMASIEPVSVLCLVAYIFRGSLWKKMDTALPALWFLVVFVALSWVGLRGQGFQMRFLAPLFPCIYLMLYALPGEWRVGRGILPVIILLGLIYAGLNGAAYLLLPQYDEISPVFTVWGQANL